MASSKAATSARHHLARASAVAIVITAIASLSPAASAAESELRVCADPNNLPFSNDKGDGFENKLADLVAHDLGKRVVYTWWAERRGFIRKTLKAGQCDVIMGVPTGIGMGVETTRPYYRSAYVFVWRKDRNLDIASMTDPRLRQLKIGVHLLGDDGFNTPPAHALGEQGIVENVVGYTIYGDYRKANPPARLIEALAGGDIDIAAVWGPLAGYFAQRSPVPLTLVPIADTGAFAPLAFQYDIAMGVRKKDAALKAQLDQILARNQTAIVALLASYGVPLVTTRDADDPAAPADPAPTH
jgi:quinoprotein dehydrogenase-associated probable ABC transporter substrate-binding protein